MDKYVFLIIGVIPLFVAIPILIYHFLVFPNIDGMIQDISWYNYDSQSQHYLYWIGFYASGIFGGLLGKGSISNGN